MQPVVTPFIEARTSEQIPGTRVWGNAITEVEVKFLVTGLTWPEIVFPADLLVAYQKAVTTVHTFYYDSDDKYCFSTNVRPCMSAPTHIKLKQRIAASTGNVVEPRREYFVDMAAFKTLSLALGVVTSRALKRHRVKAYGSTAHMRYLIVFDTCTCIQTGNAMVQLEIELLGPKTLGDSELYGLAQEVERLNSGVIIDTTTKYDWLTRVKGIV